MAQIRSAEARVAGRGWPEYLALAVGIFYALIGAAGFFWTGFSGFAATEGDLFLGVFEVNPLHNLAHLGAGVALIVAFFVGRRAVAYVAGILAAGFLLLAAAGPFITGTDANILALNGTDAVLHLLAVAALGVSAYGAWRGTGGGGAEMYGGDVVSEEPRRRAA